MIEEVRAWLPAGGGGHYYPDGSRDQWISADPIASPMSRFPGYERLGSWPVSLGGVAIEVSCSDGQSGVGVADGGLAAAYYVEHLFAPLLLGADSASRHDLWQRMFLASSVHGGGACLAALSAIDLALWDLAGKRAGLPVHQLLSRHSVREVPVYATGPRPNLYAQLGFSGAKVSLPWGPASGERGLEENVSFLERCRDSVAPDFPLAVDCFMALDGDYALTLHRRAERCALWFYEEPLMHWELEGMRRLRREGLRVATGEHASVLGLRRVIETQAADVVQPDLTSCGGLTEALRLIELSGRTSVRLLFHCGGVFSYHLAAATAAEPLCEYLFQGSRGDQLTGTFESLIEGEPLPERGLVTLPELPGWGISLAHDGLTRPAWPSDPLPATRAIRSDPIG